MKAQFAKVNESERKYNCVLQGLNSVFSLRLEDITGAFTVEPSQATGSTSVNIRVTNGSLDYENPNQRKFIILVSMSCALFVHAKMHFFNTNSIIIY